VVLWCRGVWVGEGGGVFTVFTVKLLEAVLAMFNQWRGGIQRVKSNGLGLAVTTLRASQ